MFRSVTSLLLVVGCASEPEPHCTLRGCDFSGVQLELGSFPATDFMPVTTSYAKLNVCLNEQCGEVLLHKLPQGTDSGAGTSAALIPTVTASAVLSQTEQSQIAISVGVDASDGVVLHDGDVYRVSFTSADGRLVVEKSWSVTYKTSYPNGPDCPPTCRPAMTVTEL